MASLSKQGSIVQEATVFPPSERITTSSELSNDPKQKRNILRRIQPYIWDTPDKPDEEKRFLRKLDFYLLTYACLGYFCKILSQGNISNAYISGMDTAINMGASDLTYASNVFTAGYVIGQLPAVMLAERVRPSYLVSTMEILWAVLTFATSSVKNVSQLFAVRFLVGLFESVYFPVIVYVISSWYTKEERGKRVALFYVTGILSIMFSGYLQAAVYDNLSGVMGHQGWQWLFIVCGVISLPSGLLGYFFNPDFPETTHVFYLKKEEVEWAKQRMLRQGYQALGASGWTRTKIFTIAKQWQFWVLPIGYFLIQGSVAGYQPGFALWLESAGYSVSQANVLPTGEYAVAAVVQVILAMISDSPWMKGRRWQVICIMEVIQIFSSIILAVWNVPIGLKFFAFYLNYVSAGTASLYFAWFPELIPHDHEMRGFMTAATNMFSYIMLIWFQDAVWRTALGPRFLAGYTATTCWAFGVIVLSYGLHRAEVRYVEKKKVSSFELEPTTQVQDV